MGTIAKMTHLRLLGRSVVLPVFLASGVACTEPTDAHGGDDDAVEEEEEEEREEVACPDPNEAVDPTALIDDMEDQSSSLLPIGGRSGGWWTAGDDTQGATMEPPTKGDAIPEAISGGRCGSNYAMRVTGKGFDEWGAMLGLSLVYESNGHGPYDASSRQGVTFWAKIGDTSTNRVRFAISDVNSEPEGGVCEVGGAQETGCYDTYSTMLTGLGKSWRRYRVPFAGLAQRDFGLQTEALATDALYTIQFAFDPGAVFDLWVDDIEFY